MRDWVTTSDFSYRKELPRAQKQLARENMLRRAEEEKANADAEDDKETHKVDCDVCAMATQHFCTACSKPICTIFCSKWERSS